MANSIKDDMGKATKENADDVIASITKKINDQFKGMDKAKAFEVTQKTINKVTDAISDTIKGTKNASESGVMDKIDDIYNNLAGKMEADKLLPGINKIKTVIIFGIIYRYLGPVLVTPLANKLSSKFFDKKKPEEQKTQQAK